MVTMKLRKWNNWVRELPEKEIERGANVYEKSLIWAAKDTEWKKLEEKRAVRILSGDSAEKAKTQFGDGFIPSRHAVYPSEYRRVQGSMVSARLFGSGCHGAGW